MKILYFSWLKSKTGISEEQIDDKNIKDINTLLKYISKKHPKLKKFMGKEYMGMKRQTFVIDPEGKFELIYLKVKAATMADQIVEDLALS